MVMNRVLCCNCEGLGRVAPDPFSDQTFVCHNGCDEGYFPATAADLDGKMGRFAHLYGFFVVWKGVLCLEADDGQCVINLDPETVEIMNETPPPH